MLLSIAYFAWARAIIQMIIYAFFLCLLLPSGATRASMGDSDQSLHISGLIHVSVPHILSGEKKIASLFLSLFSFLFLTLVRSVVGQTAMFPVGPRCI
jgi:hypothetical protein